jgi:hypothetical protein
MEDSVSRVTFLNIGKHMCEPERREPPPVEKPVQATIADSMDRSLAPSPDPTIHYEIHVCMFSRRSSLKFA